MRRGCQCRFKKLECYDFRGANFFTCFSIHSLNNRCNDCKPGQYRSYSMDATDCEIVPEGTYASWGADRPTICPPGRYADFTGASSRDLDGGCLRCPSGLAIAALEWMDSVCSDPHHFGFFIDAIRKPAQHVINVGQNVQVRVNFGFSDFQYQIVSIKRRQPQGAFESCDQDFQQTTEFQVSTLTGSEGFKDIPFNVSGQILLVPGSRLPYDKCSEYVVKIKATVMIDEHTFESYCDVSITINKFKLWRLAQNRC